MKVITGIRSLCILAFMGITSCASDFAVQASFPPPLVDSLPIDAGLILSESFRNYAFVQGEEDRDEMRIEIGAAQSELFQVVTGQIFREVVSEAPYDSAQLLVEPEITDFQYAFPRETRANIYEVWMKYRVQVKEANGTVLADWLINGYGKTPSAFFTSNEEAMQSAIILALRDVGVQLAIGFARQQAIVAWLQDHEGDSSI